MDTIINPSSVYLVIYLSQFVPYMSKNQNSDSSMLIGYTLGINHTARFESSMKMRECFITSAPGPEVIKLVINHRLRLKQTQYQPINMLESEVDKQFYNLGPRCDSFLGNFPLAIN